MLTIILIILIIVLLGGGAYGYRRNGLQGNGVRAILIALVLALIILAVVGFVRDEAAVGPGVPAIMDAPKPAN